MALTLSALVLGAASPCGAASLFLSGTDDNVLYRYDVEPTGTPVLSASIATPAPSGIAFSPAGELFVANTPSLSRGGALVLGTVSRFLDPLGTLLAHGTISGLSKEVEELLFRQGELLVVNQGAANIARFAFDGAQSASPNGVITGLSTNERGIAWNPATDEIFVSRCCGSNRIDRFVFDSSGHASPNGTITGGGLSSPHGMAFSPWGELFVANGASDSISRFSFDALGHASLSGTITGIGLDIPIGLRFSPWGELFVANEETSAVSRWTFDVSHNAIANGSFTTPASRLNWLEFAPSAPLSTPEPSSLGLFVVATLALACVLAKGRQLS
ncbi:MAG: hypothetical protein IPK02_22700 [Candidatus Accumulibacter sp.]|uniref:PEP-CTERM sorting domain-containing protein n=1 Tax=Candidatus Accumulibacter affinis TaxID=2954384 RepID=A0A935TE97_9PROT|nr:hypothetical protein [Candidatus Accumulibacter affinis]